MGVVVVIYPRPLTSSGTRPRERDGIGWNEGGRPTPRSHSIPRWPLRLLGPGPCFGDFWLAELGVLRSSRILPRSRSETGRPVSKTVHLEARLPFRSLHSSDSSPPLGSPEKVILSHFPTPNLLLLYCWEGIPLSSARFLGLDAPLASLFQWGPWKFGGTAEKKVLLISQRPYCHLPWLPRNPEVPLGRERL